MTDAFSPPQLSNTAAYRNKRIGLLGGTFNPPHKGHFYIAQTALSAFKLDCVWMIVTPHNPIKNDTPPLMDDRIQLSHNINPDQTRIIISDIERQMDTRVTYDTLSNIQKHFPDNDFLWVAGMDNAVTFHTWNHWEQILKLMAVSHFNRQPATLAFEDCPLYNHPKQNNVVIDTPNAYPLIPHTNYWIINSKNIPISSTQLREESQTSL